MRLAWFTPLPPIRSGIASYNTELLARLRGTHEIDVFVEDPNVASEATLPVLTRVPGSLDILNAHDFLWRRLQHSYDLVVYQLGNAVCHDYMWAYMTRFPGLVVLHDAQLHHARARSLLTLKRPDDYRAEFSFSHPGVPAPIVELGIAGHLGRLNYLWPMLGVMFATALGVAVHNSRVAADLREEFPGRPIFPITLGVPDSDPGDPDQARAQIRWQHQIPDEAVVFVMLGGVTPEKRVPALLNAVARAASEGLEVYALLVGETVAYYDARADAQTLGIGDRVRIAGYVDDKNVRQYLAAADVCVCLRWPTGRETSSSWLQCLSAGCATIVTDLAHSVDVPTLDPRSWTPLRVSAAADPVCVSIDLLDEDHSLHLAVSRLAEDLELRIRLGRRGHEYWRTHHSMNRMVEDYLRLLTAAATLPDPPVSLELPRHLRTNGTELARTLLAETGASVDFLPKEATPPTPLV